MFQANLLEDEMRERIHQELYEVPRVFERRRLRVYVAGPISSDPFEGVHRGFRASKQMFLDGMAPFLPHFDAYWLIKEEEPGAPGWNAYLEYDLEYVSVCDALYRLTGESVGASLEAEVAKSLNIPVFYEDGEPGYDDLVVFAELKGLNGVRR